MVFLIIMFSSSLWAHTENREPHTTDWSTWNFSLPIIICLILVSICYGIGWKRKRKHIKNLISSNWNMFFFSLGILILMVALISPIDPMSDMLASVHMIQHTILMMIAAPLLALAAPSHFTLWTIPAKFWSKWSSMKPTYHLLLKVLRFKRPIIISFLYAVTLWVWHIPQLYQAALLNSTIHDFQHLAFFTSSFLFWRVVLEPYTRHALNPSIGIVYLFITSLHAMLLGTLMALSPIIWYSLYEKTAPHYGLNALMDQQIAGYIMWMPAGISYVLATIYLLVKLLNPGPEKSYNNGQNHKG